MFALSLFLWSTIAHVLICIVTDLLSETKRAENTASNIVRVRSQNLSYNNSRVQACALDTHVLCKQPVGFLTFSWIVSYSLFLYL